MLLFAWGSGKSAACAPIVRAPADVLTRLNPQTTLEEAGGGRGPARELARGLPTEPRPRVARAIFLGGRELVAARLSAARRPEARAPARRRHARTVAQKRGSTPSPAPRTRLAGNLFITTVPGTGWTPETVGTAYPLRWQGELILKAGKRSLPLAPLRSKKAEPPGGDL